MEIRLKLTLQFSLLVAFLLLAILSFNYLLAYRFAQESFFDRLKQRAILIAEFQGDSPDHHHVNSSLSRNLLNESVRSYHENGKLLFSYGWSGWKPDAELLASMNSGQEFSLVDGAAYSICFPVKAEAGTVWILASATDEVGSSKLRNLAQTMFISLLVFLVFVILAGQYLSGKALEPIQLVINQVKQITARNLDLRVQHENNKDEIAQLANTFNSMLERLEISFKTQSDFVRNSSHELRNPLAAMIGQAEIALKKDRDAVYYQQVMRAIYQESLRLKHIVNSLLHLSQASSETLQKNHERLRLDELVLDVVENLLHSDPRRKIQVEFQNMDEQEPVIVGNKSLLEVATGNLVDNACKYSAFNLVSCQLSRQNSRLILKVKDSGIGMSQAEINQISEPFYRSSKVRNKEGFGIGMAVAFRVFQVHEIEVHINSVQGQGTEITLDFLEQKNPLTKPPEDFLRTSIRQS